MLARRANRFFPLTFRPLASSPGGREAARRFGIPPFVDGSIRREPDLEKRYPSITCLCRTNLFAPRLQVGDLVVYFTAKATFGLGLRQRRLIAIVQVRHMFDSHVEAARWYRSVGQPVPSNCMVKGNRPLPLSHSIDAESRTGTCGGCRSHAEWDAVYQERSEQWGRFVACDPVFRDLSWEAPLVTDEHMLKAFHEIPQTRNPRARSVEELANLLMIMGLSVQLRSR